MSDLRAEIAELDDLLELALESDDSSLDAQIERDLQTAEAKLSDLKIQLQMRGQYDQNDALLAVKTGAGGVDAQDWTEMLLRMYTRWAERRGYKTTLLDYAEADEAGVKGATMRIDGLYAYGYLSSEAGAHRLVRISPFDSGARRHTSFALVEALPAIDADEFKIDPKELIFDVFKASGHGGQSVQKNATAVRIKHAPTGVSVSVQQERSLTQNREIALNILQSRLAEIENRKRQKMTAELKGEYKRAEFGNQARSYVLHPYQIARDHRTDHKESDVQRVLDGDIDGFIKAFLEQNQSRKRV